MPLKELDCIELTVALPDEGLVAGAEGAIVHVFTNPDVAYLVEFEDKDGSELSCCTVRPDQINISWEYNSPDTSEDAE